MKAQWRAVGALAACLVVARGLPGPLGGAPARAQPPPVAAERHAVGRTDTGRRVAEGVFVTAPDGAVRFVPAQRPPTDREVGRLLAAVRRRIVRLVQRRASP